MTPEALDEIGKKLIGIMQVGYEYCDIIPEDMIDSYVSLRITVLVDSEFRSVLGDGYYK